MIDTLSTEASNIVQLRLTIPAVLYEFLAHRIQENHATAVFFTLLHFGVVFHAAVKDEDKSLSALKFACSVKPNYTFCSSKRKL